jgi:hypothetical protein
MNLNKKPAVVAHDVGHPVVVLRKESKVAFHKNWPERELSALEIQWFIMLHDFGWGIRLDDTVCVIDRDGDSAEADEWLARHGIRGPPMRVLTAKGEHWYFAMNPRLARINPLEE